MMIQKWAFYVICLIVLVGELWFLIATVPTQVAKILQLNSDYSAAASEVVIYERALAILRSVNQNELSVSLKNVNASLPSQKKAAGLVTGLATIASSSGVVLKQLEFSPGKISSDSGDMAEEIVISGSRALAVPVALTIAGGLNEAITFLEKVQGASQILGITGFNYAQTPGQGPLARVSLQVYYQPISGAPIDWSTIRDISPAERVILNSLSSRDVFILPEGKR